MSDDTQPLRSGLYVVATPIGNLEDITIRALRVLKSVDVIACESKLHSQKLLSFYQIRSTLYIYNDHASLKVRQTLLDWVSEGKRVALISNAGMPLISDPGYKLVKAFYEYNLYVTVIPGASASLTALVCSGLPTDRFMFQGFLPLKGWKPVLESLKSLEATLVFFESARRLKDSIEKIHQVLGNRPFVVMRELTKIFESRLEGFLDEWRHLPFEQIKGELVILVGGGSGAVSLDSLTERLQEALQTMSLRQSVETISSSTGLPRTKVYREALRLFKSR